MCWDPICTVAEVWSATLSSHSPRIYLYVLYYILIYLDSDEGGKGGNQQVQASLEKSYAQYQLQRSDAYSAGNDTSKNK